MANPKSFHAFTEDGAVYGGAVTNFKVAGKKVELRYEYLHSGIVVTGRFDGEHDAGGAVHGEWNDHSAAPINGMQDWQGTASLKAIDEDRFYLRGSWKMTGGRDTERWAVDVSKK